MANMTLSIPDKVHTQMKDFPEIRWSEVARRAIEQKITRLKDFERIEAIAQKSKLTQKDVDDLGKKIKAGAARRFREDASSLTRTSLSRR